MCALGSSAGDQPGLPSPQFNLGIPAEQTERIITITREQTGVMESENQDTYISIPALFQQKETPVQHGLVLKTGTADSRNKTILLTPRIDIDLEIPEESIHPLPDPFTGLFSFISGVCFSRQSMILILDLKKLLDNFK